MECPECFISGIIMCLMIVLGIFGPPVYYRLKGQPGGPAKAKADQEEEDE